MKFTKGNLFELSGKKVTAKEYMKDTVRKSILALAILVGLWLLLIAVGLLYSSGVLEYTFVAWQLIVYFFTGEWARWIIAAAVILWIFHSIQQNFSEVVNYYDQKLEKISADIDYIHDRLDDIYEEVDRDEELSED